MTPDQMVKLREIKCLLAEAYDDYFRRSEDGHCKSEEGAIEVGYANYFSETYGSDEAEHIGVYSYVLGPSRMHYFDTFDEALETVRKWHKEQLEFDYSDVGC